MTAATSGPVGKARATFYFVDCPSLDGCNGYLMNPVTMTVKWAPEDFKRGSIGECDECGGEFKVRR